MAAPKPPANPPTLREIARRAGVSHTTVSLSLRNHPSIPEKTRERLRRLAEPEPVQPAQTIEQPRAHKVLRRRCQPAVV